jgi:hypothetical protein
VSQRAFRETDARRETIVKWTKPIIGITATAALIGAALMVATAGSGGAATSGLLADHALFDGTGADTAVSCRGTNEGAFIVYGAFRASGGDVTMRVTFKDGDFVEYPIPQDTSFSFSEAAGGTPSVDRKIVVTASAGTGDLVGWLSAARSPGSGTYVSCTTT